MSEAWAWLDIIVMPMASNAEIRVEPTSGSLDSVATLLATGSFLALAVWQSPCPTEYGPSC
jgi:hypothetical protein